MRRLTALVVLLASADAAAQTVYKWVDENGETHYSQTLPPDRVQQEHSRLDEEGRVTAEVNRALTVEERLALAEQARIEREAAALAEEKAQRDRLFLAAYPTEEAVISSIDAQRDVLVAEFESVDSLADQARARLNQAVDQAASMQRRGREVPKHIQDDVARARANLAELNVRRNELQGRLDGLGEVQARELARFRRLTGSDPDATETEGATEDRNGDAGTG
jgi:predicted RNase H-like nuclease (RuvC/YqgF family)